MIVGHQKASKKERYSRKVKKTIKSLRASKHKNDANDKCVAGHAKTLDLIDRGIEVNK